MHRNQVDSELVKFVYEDLQLLQTDTTPDSKEIHLRRTSVQLRKLISDDSLKMVWRILEMEPKAPIIIAPRLDVDSFDTTVIAYAQGGQIGGTRMSNFQFVPRALTTKERTAMFEKGPPSLEYPFPLHIYKDSCGIFAYGKKISRVQIIKYVANKKGGAHYDDNKRKKNKEAYTVLDDIIKSGAFFGGTFIHPVIPGPLAFNIEGGLNPVYMELLSIGQNIIKSPDIQRLLEECKKFLNK